MIPGLSLCTIVRDEMKNPAGGIEKFIEAHVPYVENAIIIDTGSVDGTREKLEKLSNKHNNMFVFDKKFNGYADARNYSLEKAKIKWILCLDADELITSKEPENNWKEIDSAIKKNPNFKVFKLDIVNLYPEGFLGNVPYWSYRLFEKNKIYFQGEIMENIVTNGHYDKLLSNVRLYHFLPPAKALSKKYRNWNMTDAKFRKNTPPLE